MIRGLYVVIASFFGKQYNNRGRWIPLLHLPLLVFPGSLSNEGGIHIKGT